MKRLLVAPSPLGSGKSRRFHLGRESLERALFGRAVAFWVAPFPESHCIQLGRESRAISTCLESSEKLFLKSRRLHDGLENCAISI